MDLPQLLCPFMIPDVLLTQTAALLKGAVAWWLTEEDIPHYTIT